MFPVSVCLRIESKRFVEEETQRKRLGSLRNESACRTCHFLAAQPRWWRYFKMSERYLKSRLSPFVIPSEVEGFRSVTVRLLRGIPRLRFAPLGMRQLI